MRYYDKDDHCYTAVETKTFVHDHEVSFSYSYPDCNANANGTVTATVDPSSDFTCYWTDESGTIVQTGQLTLSAPTGDYKFHYQNTICDTDCGEFVYDVSIEVPELKVEVYNNSVCNQSLADVEIKAFSVSPDGVSIPGTYHFDWYSDSNGSLSLLYSSQSNEFSYYSLASGSYAVVVKNINTNCERLKYFEVAASPPIQITVETIPCLCHGSHDGVGIARATGGIKPFSYAWRDRTTQEIICQSARCDYLYAGNFTVIVVDNAGCTDSVYVALTQPTTLSWANQPDTNGCSATVYPAGGTPPYTLYWTGPGGKLYTTSNTTISNLVPGDYSVYFNDAHNCGPSSTQTFTIYDPVTHVYNMVFRFSGEPTINPVTPEDIQQYDIPRKKDELIAQVEDCIEKSRLQMEYNIENTCLDTDLHDTLSIKTTAQYYHHTLYYYDRAGNLVQTVPPEGVDADNTLSTHPSHTLQTQYKYNSIGQLVEQSTPDGGTTKFWYNSVGQLRLSQNDKQLTDQQFAYSKYDNLGRIIETGLTDYISTFADSLDIGGFPRSSAGNEEQVFTVYTTPAGITYYGESQNYTLNRVSYSYNAAGVKTVYSYDPHGNVEWIVQHIPGLGDNYIRYEYDLISGKVTEVAYNEYNADRFFHRYSYDEDNRITSCETSRDHVIWDEDADYEYFAHGPLKRTEIGEDHVQGIDYTYTLQGWLKAINNTMDDATLDPGSDGTTGSIVPKDDFGMTLGYFAGDFQNANFNTMFSNTNGYQSTDLYNGNISSWSFYNSNVPGEIQVMSGSKLGFDYGYDYLNRIKDATLHENTSGVWNLTTEYNADYQYDKNGNLEALNRNTHGTLGNNTIDQLAYTYTPGTNQLSRVTDTYTGSLDGTKNDITGQVEYDYDAIGNLVSETGGDYTLNISWTAYGKVDKVRRIETSKTTVIDFTYDATGNRVRKDVYTENLYPDGMVSTFYVRDASGNIMAIYNRMVDYQALQGEYNNEWYLTERPIYGSSRVGVDKTEMMIGDTTTSSFNATTDTLYAYKPVLNTYNEFNEEYLSEWQNWIMPTIDYNVTPEETRLLRHYFTGSGTPTELGCSDDYELDRNLSMYCDRDNDTLLIAYAFANTDGDTYMGFGAESPSLQSSFTMDQTAQSIIFEAPGSNGDEYYLVYRNTKGQLEAQMFAPEKLSFETVLLDANDGIGYSFAAIEVMEYDEKAYLYYTEFKNDPLEGVNQDNWLKVIEFGEGGYYSNPYIITTKLGPDSRDLCEIQISADGRYLAWGSNRATLPSPDKKLFVHLLENDYLSPTLNDEVKITSLHPNDHISLDFSSDSEKLFFSFESSFSSAYTGIYYYDIPLMGPVDKLSATIYGTVRRTWGDDIAVVKPGSFDLYLLADGDPDNTFSTSSIGSERLDGIVPNQVVRIDVDYPEPLMVWREPGNKRYELTDHLGNVRTVITDTKTTTLTTSGDVDLFTSTVTQANDYYPFGSLLDGRAVSAASEDYRFLFGGMESDDEVKGTGNSYTTMFRQYDPRVGRWLSIDPLFKNYVWQSPYVAFDNSPINKSDPRGDAAGEPEKITKAASNAVKKVKENDPSGSTPARCNKGVNYAFKEITGSSELNGKTANQMVSHFESSEDWSTVDISKVQELANQGEVIIATYKTTSGSGHVALAVPGKAETSKGTWDSESAKDLDGGIPKLMDTGYGMRTTSQSANYSFGKTKQKSVVFYKYTPALSNTNPSEVPKENKFGIPLDPVEITGDKPSYSIKRKPASLIPIENPL